MECEFLSEIQERLVRSFLDVLIMMELRNTAMSGYDLGKSISKKFRLFISPGTVYSTLYYSERRGLTESIEGPRKRVYILTNEGEKKVKMFLQSQNKILELLRSLFASSPQTSMSSVGKY